MNENIYKIFLVGNAKSLKGFVDDSILGENVQIEEKDFLSWVDGNFHSEGICLLDQGDILAHFQSYSRFQDAISGKGPAIILLKEQPKGEEWTGLWQTSFFIPFMWGFRTYPQHQWEYEFLMKDLQVLMRLFLEKNRFHKELLNLSQHLHSLTSEVQKEVERVKGFHRKFIPKRFEDIKGIKFLGKFAAGSSSGGEYFDIIRKGNKVILLMSQVNSYLMTGSILQLVSEVKKVANQSKIDLISMLVYLEKMAKDVSGESKIEFSLLLAEIDLIKFTIEGHRFGHYSLLDSKGKTIFEANDFPVDMAFAEKSAFTMTLERSEKYFLFSPGLVDQWNSLGGGARLNDIINIQGSKDLQEILDEYFITIKKNQTSDFLDKDCSMIGMEVSKNVIVEV